MVRKKRQYKKQRHKQGTQRQDQVERQPTHFADIDIMHPEGFSSEDEGLSAVCYLITFELVAA